MNKTKNWLVLLLFVFYGCMGKPTSRLEGVVQLEEQSNYEGIHVYLPGTQYRAITNEDGFFVMEGMTPDLYTLVAEKEDYETYRQEIALTRGENSLAEAATLQTIVPEVGSISGFITLQGETTHEGITVMVIDESLSTLTNTTGFFELKQIPPGTYTITAYKEGWLPLKQGGVKVTANSNTKLPETQLKPEPSQPESVEEEQPVKLGDNVIKGYSFLQGNLQHGGIHVFLKHLPGIKTITNATGYYVLSGIDNNTHTVVFEHEGYITEEIEGIEPVAPDSNRITTFVTLQKAEEFEGEGILRGKVLLQGKENHSNTIVRLEGNQQPVVTGENGNFLFVGIDAGIYTLIAEHPGYETARTEDVRVLANQINQMPEITLQSTSGEVQGNGSISGYAYLEEEQDHAGILVAIEGTEYTMVTGPDGAFEFNGIEVGYYNLIFTKANYKDALWEGAPVIADANNELEPVVLELDIDPPRVIDTFPRPNTRDVPIVQGIDVMLKFSERMNGASVKDAVMIDPPVSFEAFFDRESDLSDLDVLHLRLYQDAPEPVRFHTQYFVMITPVAQTPKGVSLEEPFEFSFRTGGPLIVGSVPEQGARGFQKGISDPILIETNAPVDQQTVQRSLRFRPRPESEPMVEVLPVGLGSQILIYISLKPGTSYRLMFDSNLHTIDGLRFDNVPYSFSFTTQGIGTERFSRSRRSSSRRTR